MSWMSQMGLASCVLLPIFAGVCVSPSHYHGRNSASMSHHSTVEFLADGGLQHYSSLSCHFNLGFSLKRTLLFLEASECGHLFVAAYIAGLLVPTIWRIKKPASHAICLQISIIRCFATYLQWQDILVLEGICSQTTLRIAVKIAVEPTPPASQLVTARRPLVKFLLQDLRITRMLHFVLLVTSVVQELQVLKQRITDRNEPAKRGRNNYSDVVKQNSL